jgi:hypothetical protein
MYRFSKNLLLLDIEARILSSTRNCLKETNGDKDYLDIGIHYYGS